MPLMADEQATANDFSRIGVCVYYNADTYEIQDIIPKAIEERLRTTIGRLWSETIPREILIALSTQGQITATQLRELIGHSPSTLHENIKILEDAGLIETSISYVGNKQRILSPKVLLVSKNPRYKTLFQRFFQGLFINSEKTRKILATLNEEPGRFFTAEELSVRTGIPADEIDIHMSNWDSQMTRTLSNFLKDKPFEKRILYRAAERR